VYGVAKHAVVRLTEALYASLREMGAKIGVSLLCPGLVRTNIYRSERNRPAHLRQPESPGTDPQAAGDAAPSSYARAMTPEKVADQVVDAIRHDRFYVVTTSAYDDAIRSRLEDVLARRNPVFPSLRDLVQRDSTVR
jgi:short-subunit dehydrogenase